VKANRERLKVTYEYTLSDPAYLAQPHEARIDFTHVPDDTPIYPYHCELESAAQFSKGLSLLLFMVLVPASLPAHHSTTF